MRDHVHRFRSAAFGEYIDVEPADSGVLNRRLTHTLNSARQRLDELRGVGD